MSDKPLKLEEPDLSGTYTAKDYLSWQLDELVELIRGKIYKMYPSPTSNHQRISGAMLYQFHKVFSGNHYEVFPAPFDVYLVKPGQDYKETKNIVEPDLCVICEPSKIKKFGCVGTPDLMVEILSPSTSQKDRELKFELYEEYGVREYWIVSPEQRNVTVSVLEDDKFKSQPPVFDGEKLKSIIFPRLAVDLKEVFKNVKE